MPLLEVKDLKTQFFTRDGVVHAVDGVSFELAAGETLGIVGESGCGKSVTALSLMPLIPQPPGRITQGSIVFDGQDVLKMDDDDVRSIRGNNIAMIFQDPMTSLNPVLTISRQISEALELHLKMDKSEARKRTVELLDLVGIPGAKKRLDDYPHQFSGGMRQRVMIAMALSCNPKLILADEPTTALDVTIQAQILDLLKNLAREFRTAFILITHDLGVVAGMTQRIHVMYGGKIVEKADTAELFANPKMPYTWASCGRSRAWMSGARPSSSRSRAFRRTSSRRRRAAGLSRAASTGARCAARRSPSSCTSRTPSRTTRPGAGAPSRAAGSSTRTGAKRSATRACSKRSNRKSS